MNACLTFTRAVLRSGARATITLSSKSMLKPRCVSNRGHLADVLPGDKSALSPKRSIHDFDMRSVFVGRDNLDWSLIVDLLGGKMLLHRTDHSSHPTLLRAMGHFDQRLLIRVKGDGLL